MDAATILDIALQAARLVRRRYDLQWTPEDWQDARQEAAAGVVRALRDAPGMPHGYYVVAARQGATRFAFRQANGDHSVRAGSLARANGTDIEDGQPLDPQSRGWSRPLDDEDLPALRRLLSRATRRAGARGGPKTRDQLAVARDIFILRALSEGRSQAQIGEALGLPKNHVHKYLQQIRRRLAAYQEA
jgi:DNA-binding NarL/FixJ family response regulator